MPSAHTIAAIDEALGDVVVGTTIFVICAVL
jgi:hypothetical protein